MRRLRIPVLYDIQYQSPQPLVPRRLRYEVTERIGPRGETWTALDEDTVRDVAEQIRQDDVEAVAIALLHSYADDAHERRVEEIVREAVGDERLRDALVGDPARDPRVRAHEHGRRQRLRRAGDHALPRLARRPPPRRPASAPQLEVMQSSGGTLTPATARRKPAHLVESGPAAGVMACSYLGRLTGRRQLISLDMGGTTAKAAIVEDGEPVRTSEYEVGAGINLSSKLVKGGGHPIKLPFIDVSEIGAGGGSIVAIDELGNVTVGPVSAGSDPGPACYGLGGESPTLTDALLALGYLNATQLGGGAITLDPQRSRDVLDRVVATPLGPIGRGRRLRNPDARGRDDDARRQGGHHLPRPRPARLHAVRVRRQRPADRRRDRPLARDDATSSSLRRPASSALSGCSSPTPSTRSCGR